MKSILKEIIIILILCVAILVILGAIFYDYIPTNKIIPSTVEAYKTSNTIKDEISQNVTDYTTGSTTITKEITESQLDFYKKNKSYSQGKANPFANVTEQTNQTHQTNGETGTNQNTVIRNNTSNPDSTNHFYNNTGLK